ncbi:hypothetical protein C6P86_01865 [Burkholderia multivorans]|nr:hypothetical protein C6P86_01865 [Burkholderia multivorans]PRE88377.1 hypothetical protein C6Q00_09035 [Burkholderia multivorans]PRG21395.1 hypothetical protein C6T57_16965 [Burkholderia multivorans]
MRGDLGGERGKSGGVGRECVGKGHVWTTCGELEWRRFIHAAVCAARVQLYGAVGKPKGKAQCR